MGIGVHVYLFIVIPEAYISGRKLLQKRTLKCKKEFYENKKINIWVDIKQTLIV